MLACSDERTFERGGASSEGNQAAMAAAAPPPAAAALEAPAAAEPVVLSEETVAKVVRQVEFYFSDSNLPRDKFLLQSIRASPDGLVPLATIISFSRMRTHLGLTAPTTTAAATEPGDGGGSATTTTTAAAVPAGLVQAVAAALRPSAALRVAADGTAVGRAAKTADLDAVRAEVDARTVAAGPFPYDATIEGVERVVAALGEVRSVRLPRGPGKVFCGTALVEFATREAAARAVETGKVWSEELGVDVEVEEREALEGRLKAAWEERNKGEEGEVVEKEGGGGGEGEEDGEKGKGKGENGKEEEDWPFPEGLIVKFAVSRIGGGDGGAVEGDAAAAAAGGKDASNGAAGGGAADASVPVAAEGEQEATPMQEDPVVADAAVATGADETAAAAAGEGSGGKADETTTAAAAGEEGSGDKAAKEEAAAPAAAPPSSIDGVLKREHIKELMAPYGTVKFVDFCIGDAEGYLRFAEAEEAQRARTAAVLAPQGGLEVLGYLMTLEAVDGDAEKEYWRKLRQGQGRKRNMSGGGGGGRQWGRGGGGRGSGRGRGRGGRGWGQERGGGQENGKAGGGGSHKRFRDEDDDGGAVCNGNGEGAAAKKAEVAASDVMFE